MMKVKEWLEDRRKPKMIWSPEMANDLLNFQSINAERELIKILADEINQEILKNLRINQDLTNDEYERELLEQKALEIIKKRHSDAKS